MKKCSSAKSALAPSCSSCHGKQCAPLVYCQREELELVIHSKTCQRYQKGQLIFQEGSPTLGLYCVHNGKIKVTKVGGDDKEQILRLAKEGDTLGLGSLMTGSNHSHSAVALQEAVVCFIPRSTFLSLLTCNTQFCTAVMKLLADALSQAEERMLHLAYKPVRERLADALLLLLHTYQAADQSQFSISITREDLASLVGTAKETTIRLLSELKNDGIVASKGSQITVLRPEKLHDIAALYD